MTAHLPKEQISAWIDRQLDAREAALVEAHVQECESCQHFQEELSIDTRMFRELEVLAPSPFLWTRVAAELDQPKKRERFEWLRWRGIALPRSQALLAIAAALFMVLGGAFFFILRQQAASRTEMAAIAQIDQAHAALAAKNAETYNPFRTRSLVNPDANPFARHPLDSNSNPFASSRENR